MWWWPPHPHPHPHPHLCFWFICNSHCILVLDKFFESFRQPFQYSPQFFRENNWELQHAEAVKYSKFLCKLFQTINLLKKAFHLFSTQGQYTWWHNCKSQEEQNFQKQENQDRGSWMQYCKTLKWIWHNHELMCGYLKEVFVKNISWCWHGYQGREWGMTGRGGGGYYPVGGVVLSTIL